MSVVVSDTSPIVCLTFLGHENFLSELFGEVFVPTAVAFELARSVAGPIDVASILGVSIRSPKDSRSVQSLDARLDAGETEAISLAIELSADLLLIDEAVGRQIAKGLGLATTGTIGVLLRSKQVGKIISVRPLLDRLREELGFFISNTLYAQVITLSGESAS